MDIFESLCRLISMAWQIAGTRYKDPKLVKKGASSLLSSSNKDGVKLEYYNCRTSGGKWSDSLFFVGISQG